MGSSFFGWAGLGLTALLPRLWGFLTVGLGLVAVGLGLVAAGLRIIPCAETVTATRHDMSVMIIDFIDKNFSLTYMRVEMKDGVGAP